MIEGIKASNLAVKYIFTIIGMLVAIVLLITTIYLDLEIFEYVIEFLKGLEKFEIDEFILPLMILGAFVYVDVIRRQRLSKINNEKIKIYQAMLTSTHHILNNFLNQMQLIKMAAEETDGFDPEVLILYDQIIRNASAQIRALSNIDKIDETSIESAVSPLQK